MRAKRFLTWATAIVLSLNTAAFAAEAAVIVQPGVVIGGGNNTAEGPQYSLAGEGEAESGQAVMIITGDGEVIKSGEDAAGETPEGQGASAQEGSSGDNAGQVVAEGASGAGVMDAGTTDAGAAEAGGSGTAASDPAAESIANRNTLVATSDPNIFYINGRQIDKTRPVAALTYDDGPHPPVGNRIMDVMAQYGQKCTFFMVGDRVSGRADEVKRMAAEGHELANHSYSHAYLNKVSAEAVRQEVAACNDAIAAVGGVRPGLMRLPGGLKNDTVMSNIGMPVILWNIDTRDWKTRNSDQVTAEVLNNIKDGDVVLMHELYNSTADATERIVPELTLRGFQLVTVSELAAIKGVGLNPGQIYYSF